MDDALLAERFEAVVSGAMPEATDLTAEENADLQLLVRLARAIPPATAVLPGPDPDFVTAMGVQLREEAHRRTVAAPAPGPETGSSVRRLRLLPGGGRTLRWAGGLVAAALVLLGVLGVASRQALPGDLLYPVKQMLDRIAVQVSGSHYDTGMTWLAQAEQHIGEAKQLIDEGAPPAGDVTSAYDSASNAVRNAEHELALDWQQNHADRARLALPNFAATAVPLLDAARPDVPAGSVPAWQELRDLLAPYAAMKQTGSITPPGVDPTGLPSVGATTTAPPVLPTGTATPPVGGTATATATPTDRPPVLPTATVPLPTVSVPLPTATVPLPTVSVPLPTATVPLPTVSVPLPTVSIPLPTVTLPSATIPLPTVSVPLPTVSVPLPTPTVPLPTVSVPLPTVTLPGLAPGAG